MKYFTIYHIIALAVIFVLFVVILVAIVRNRNAAITTILMVIHVIMMSLTAIATMLIIDKQTKVATITDFRWARLLVNENLVFNGYIKNSGSHFITKCTISITISDQPTSTKRFEDAFSKQSFISIPISLDIFSKDSDKQITADIAQKLQPGEVRSFTASMPYPTDLSSINVRHKLHCY